MDPWPYISATYGIGFALLAGFGLKIFLERKKLRQIESALNGHNGNGHNPENNRGAA